MFFLYTCAKALTVFRLTSFSSIASIPTSQSFSLLNAIKFMDKKTLLYCTVEKLIFDRALKFARLLL